MGEKRGKREGREERMEGGKGGRDGRREGRKGWREEGRKGKERTKGRRGEGKKSKRAILMKQQQHFITCQKQNQDAHHHPHITQYY